jgi:ketosteroid isomerase-like protein
MTAVVDTAAARAARQIFAAMDSGDVDTLGRHLTDDVRFQLGNVEVITGKSAFEATFRGFLQLIAAIRHELLDLWEVEGGTVIAPATVHYERLDGETVSLPCCSIFRTRDGLVHDYRVYMDIDPVFAASSR